MPAIIARLTAQFQKHLEAARGVGLVRMLGNERAERQLQEQQLFLLLLPGGAVAQLRVDVRPARLRHRQPQRTLLPRQMRRLRQHLPVLRGPGAVPAPPLGG